MSKFVPMNDALSSYVLAHRSPDDAVLEELRAETARHLPDKSVMQIAADQGTFLGLLVAAMGARRALEVGTFTGYSAICIARALGAGGRLLCCDVSEEWTGIARRFWQKAGVDGRIDLRIAPAAETLRALPEREEWDLAFIDADKPGYPVYYEEILRRLRPGGLLLADNVLWMGRVADPSADDPATRAIRAFNALVARDERVEKVMLPISDGLTLARKL